MICGMNQNLFNCFVPGHCFSGMQAYLLDMATQMEAKHSQPLSMSSLVDCQAAAANIMSMIRSDSTSSETSDDGILPAKLVGQIEFHEVCFAYPHDPVVLENLSFTITAGRTFAVVGPSGSGKSTIISMVRRLYKPISGKVLSDGQDIRSIRLKWLREQTGLVSQEPTLFATTTEAENRSQVIEAAKAANAHSFIQVIEAATDVGLSTFTQHGCLEIYQVNRQTLSI
ncbi:hypothetical protein Dsin_029193 [Dipteronia sinensis]|uniref:ABC transporter domain-containing protein n=1 Tax=Dipteronia sinensis TaxID=43782 RepID=A0AAD9ZS70_9ROSI|nr:hypothetical protein Dsin_029193 [Dipteronia sinensis]